MEDKEQEMHENLERGLKNRHIQLIGLGGAIGVGLFLGSATAIELAGLPGLRGLQCACGTFLRPEVGLSHRLDVLVHVDGHLYGRAHCRRDIHEFLVSGPAAVAVSARRACHHDRGEFHRRLCLWRV